MYKCCFYIGPISDKTECTAAQGSLHSPGMNLPDRRENVKKALIAMSGGVDSSVAALLTKEQGYDIAGVTLKMFGNELIGVEGDSTCCSTSDVEDAESVCRRLGVPFYVFNFADKFEKEVVQRFVKAYEEGRTPNPCIDCNRYLKFGALFQRMEELGYDCIVTGHYARIEQAGRVCGTEADIAGGSDTDAESRMCAGMEADIADGSDTDAGSRMCAGIEIEPGRFLLKKALDPKKDQSYVLYSLTQEQLSHVLFPLGSMTKDETRKMAEAHGFINAKKHDSQDICFVPDGDYTGFIGRYTGKEYPHGDFVDEDGRVLGEHKGLIRYTVGQRKGLGLALPAPLYVCRKDIDRNQVVLAPNDRLFSKTLTVSDFNWIAFDEPEAPFRAAVKVRYSQKESPAEVTPLGGGKVRIDFDEPERAITPGQAAVVYDGDIVIGGGTIK